MHTLGFTGRHVLSGLEGQRLRQALHLAQYCTRGQTHVFEMRLCLLCHAVPAATRLFLGLWSAHRYWQCWVSVCCVSKSALVLLSASPCALLKRLCYNQDTRTRY